MGKSIISRGTGSPDFVMFPVRRIDAIRSDKDVHFTEALVKNASEQENLTGLESDRITITGITLKSKQALRYRLLFFSRDTFTDSDLDDDVFIGAVELDLSTYGELR